MYADIAFTLGKRALDIRYHGQQQTDELPDICDMTVEKAIIIDANRSSTLIRAALKMDWASRRGKVEFYRVDNAGKRIALHAKCAVEIQSSKVWTSKWQSQLYLITRSIQQLVDGVDKGSTHKIRRRMAYKIFSAEVQYGPAYQGMEEVLFDSEGLEASAKVRLNPTTAKVRAQPDLVRQSWSPVWFCHKLQ